MTDKLKIGDKVRVLRRQPGTPESAVGKTFTIMRIGGSPAYGLNVPGGQGVGDLWWYDAADIELVRDRPKVACILTEKITIGDVPCRKILGFEGIMQKEDLPKEYVAGRPAFWSCGIKEGHGHFYYEGGRMHYNGCNNSERIDVNLPRGASPEIDTDGKFLMLHEGDIWPEATFQNIMTWLRRAGSRLAKIRRQEKAAWSGKETIEI